MEVVILAGGKGTRLSEETGLVPKPLVKIGDMPILWHIMQEYIRHSHTSFNILAGYKQEIVKDFFHNFDINYGTYAIFPGTGSYSDNRQLREGWTAQVINSGLESLTARRLLYFKKWLKDSNRLNEPFLLTYGDAVSDVNISELIDTHFNAKNIVTMTAVKPAGRFGEIKFNSAGTVTDFKEKPTDSEGGWINGGYFVCSPEVWDYIPETENEMFERGPLEKIAAAGKLGVYQHPGFWKCMDTLKDKLELDDIYEKNLYPTALFQSEELF